MTNSRTVGAVGGCFLILALAVLTASAQQRSYAPAGQASQPLAGIALLDVSRIFKNHARFQAMMKDMKADVEQAEAAMKKERETINNMIEQLKGLKPGTQDYKQLEQMIATRQADMNVQVQLQRKDFLLREARIYHAIYQELEQEVRFYANNMGITMVLRYNGEPVDPENPEDVLRNINKPVVCFTPGMDITDQILERLNARSGGVTGNAPQGQPPRIGVPNPNSYRR